MMLCNVMYEATTASTHCLAQVRHTINTKCLLYKNNPLINTNIILQSLFYSYSSSNLRFMQFNLFIIIQNTIFTQFYKDN